MGLGALLIRADAGCDIGVGHVMRCLALAQAWQDQGGSAIFALAKTAPAIEEKLRTENCIVESVPGRIGSNEDAGCTAGLGRRHAAAWIVLDGYRFDPNYQGTIKDIGFKLLMIDDLGGSQAYFADLILNQNVHAAEAMYPNRQGQSRCLLGSRFALLRREFRSVPVREQRTEARRVLITMGGSDPGNATARVLDALRAIPERLEVKVVVGPANSSAEGLTRALPGAHQIQIISNPDFMVDLMSWADIAVSAAGSTVWEMCRLGLPAILISIADNQEPGAEELGRKGIAVYLGPRENARSSDITNAVVEVLRSPERRTRMSRAGQRLVDGRGAERVVTALQASPLRIRRATQEDCWLLWQWVNDPQVRAASFNSQAISREDHAAWFARRLNSTDSAIYIAEDSSGVPVGQFRVEWHGDKGAVVDISVAPEKRGAGIASSIIAEGAQTALREGGLQQLHAYIKPANSASQRAFESAFFTRIGEEPMGGQPAIHYVRKKGQLNYGEIADGN